MAERTAPRVTRLLGLVTYLERHGEASVEELAERFDVTAEQIRKDVDTLWVSGVPGHGPEDLIDFDAWALDDGIVRITNSQGVSQVRLSPREAVALIGALSALVAAGAAPEAASSALAKLKAAVGDVDAVVVSPTRAVNRDVVATLTEAIEKMLVVRVDYVDALDRRSTRDIEAHRIVAIDGAAYVECYCYRAGDYRTLRIDRIKAATLTDISATQPSSASGGFTLEPRFDAVITAARGARWMIDNIPGSVVEDDGESIVARFGVATIDLIAAQLLTVGPMLRTIEPPELARAVAAKAADVLAAQA